MSSQQIWNDRPFISETPVWGVAGVFQVYWELFQTFQDGSGVSGVAGHADGALVCVSSPGRVRNHFSQRRRLTGSVPRRISRAAFLARFAGLAWVSRATADKALRMYLSTIETY